MLCDLPTEILDKIYVSLPWFIVVYLIPITNKLFNQINNKIYDEMTHKMILRSKLYMNLKKSHIVDDVFDNIELKFIKKSLRYIINKISQENHTFDPQLAQTLI